MSQLIVATTLKVLEDEEEGNLWGLLGHLVGDGLKEGREG